MSGGKVLWSRVSAAGLGSSQDSLQGEKTPLPPPSSPVKSREITSESQEKKLPNTSNIPTNLHEDIPMISVNISDLSFCHLNQWLTTNLLIFILLILSSELKPVELTH